MSSTKNRFTFKFILSYLVMGALAVAVSYFLYTEYQVYNQAVNDASETDKIIETGALINLMYETDSYGRLAVLTTRKEDFTTYANMVDSLYLSVDEIKEYVIDSAQLVQLDSIKTLLNEKKRTIEDLRVLKIASNRDTSFDDVLDEFKDMGNTVGIISADALFKDADKLDSKSYEILKDLARFYSETSPADTTKVPAATVDSLLTTTRYIVREAQRENSRMRKAFQRQENELIQNDLTISSQLEEIITNFDAEISAVRIAEQQQRQASLARTKEILQIAGIAGTLIVFLFSYLILTDYFKAERLKRKLREEKAYSDSLLKSREQLISAVSHDLKTPLQTISGYSELLKNNLAPEKQQQYLNRIGSSSGFVTQLVDDLLDFSKLEAGKLTLEQIPFSLESLLRESGESSRDRYIDKGIDLTFEIDETIASHIFVSDPLRIRQIVNNLTGNAFKFTEEGSVTLFAEAIETYDDLVKARITVRDTGVGISPEKQQEIFKEFTQADGNIAGKFGGSGLGLAISQRLTHLLGGSITVESEPGKGSSFMVVLPLQIAKDWMETSTNTTFQLVKPLSGIVVDDDPSILAMLKDLLDSQGVSCRTFHGVSALNEEESVDADFILTDIQMPGTDGFQLLQDLHEGQWSWFDEQPVLAMTGNREISENIYAEKGFATVLQKPFQRDSLLSALNGIFPGHFSEVEVQPAAQSFGDKNELYDLSLLRSFLETDEALAYTLDIFFTETAGNMEAMRSAFRGLEYGAIRKTAHKMLTMSRQLHAHKVTPILERLEQVTPETTVEDELAGLWDGLDKEVTQLVDALRKLVS